jgi:anaerobic selenocysteine-containing dehydrogenase
MGFKSGDRVQVESQSTERPARTGVVEEVVHGTADPRYRIRWDDGHETVYTPAAGALQPAKPAKGA